MSILEVKNLQLSYRTDRGLVRAVNGTSFTLDAGQALGLVGESGSGKSSLALALMRLLPRNADQLEGSIVLDGEDVLSLSEDEFRRRYRGSIISMGFQGAMNSLNPVMRIGHQIAEALLVDSKLSKSEAYRKAHEMLELVGLTKEIFSRYPHELSGGMKQRVVIAMALVQNPKLVILDEPTSTLDIWNQLQDKIKDSPTCIFLNTRNDRRYRTHQLLNLIFTKIKPNVLIVRGEKLPSAYYKYKQKNPGIHTRELSYHAGIRELADEFSKLDNYFIVGIGNMVGWGEQFIQDLKKYKV